MGADLVHHIQYTKKQQLPLLFFYAVLAEINKNRIDKSGSVD